jgi:hypothetical protein
MSLGIYNKGYSCFLSKLLMAENSGYILMNIFLCSTVRHLLFSLLKAIKQSDQKNIIFMICDQQNIDKNNFDVSYLPKHVEVVFFNRSDLRKKVYSGAQGKLIKLMANYKVSLPAFFQKKVTGLIFNQALAVNLTIEELSSARLYLYNDRNKMSRLFRLAFNYYHLIDEGLSNYSGKPLKPHEKLISFVSGSKKQKRFFGDDERCKSISLINAEKAPEELKNKVQQIDFINAESVNKYCCDFFKVSISTEPQCVLATQPLESSDVDMAIYKKIIFACQKNNFTVAIKPHPREDISRYVAEFPGTFMIESKIPLELVIFKANKNINILSIYSSAGLGFEDYSTSLKLIEDNELENINLLFSQWRKDLNLVDSRLDRMFIKLNKHLDVI